jgi:putative endonuclease
MTGYVYMTASQKRGTIYIGVTNDLARRMPEHRDGKGRASPRDTASGGLSGTKSTSTFAMPSSGRSR